MRQEQKPPFSAIPPALLEKIARVAGSPVVSGETVYGGFSAAANFRLDLQDGRAVFAKGAHPEDLSHATQHLRQELRAYETVPLLQTLSPRFLGHVSDGDEDGWSLGLWEYIGRGGALSLPALMQALAAWQKTPAPAGLPHCRALNYIAEFFTPEKKWKRLRDEPAARRAFLRVFEDAQGDADWLDKNLQALIALQERAADAALPETLMHGDLRGDNVLAGAGGKIYVVDWPNACRGPAAFDLLFLFTSMEGGIGCTAAGRVEDLLDAYEAAGGARPPAAALHPLAAAIAGYFATQAGRAAPARMPRLRWMQGGMLRVLLAFLARGGAIAPPPA